MSEGFLRLKSIIINCGYNFASGCEVCCNGEVVVGINTTYFVAVCIICRLIFNRGAVCIHEGSERISNSGRSIS